MNWKRNLQLRQYFGSEFHPITLAQRAVRIFFYFAYLSRRETKMKIISNRKLTVFKDIIKDTKNNRHKERM